jgi:hypothetical protein
MVDLGSRQGPRESAAGADRRRFWMETSRKLSLKLGFRLKIKADSRFKPQAYIEYVEDLKRESNADDGLEDIFKTASTRIWE